MLQPAPWYYQMISLAGAGGVCALAWLSAGRRRGQIHWLPVAMGMALQLVMAAFVFLLPPGRSFLLVVNDLVAAVLSSAQAGIVFCFGPLAVAPGQTGPGGEPSLGFILAVQSLATVVFFMALAALLYQAGLMQRVVNLFARLFLRTLGTSGAESLGVASTIFVGVETAGTVRPFLPEMTRSELFCLLTACLATVASTVLGAYTMMLKDVFPNIAGHMVSASLISAPASVVVAKLMEPETEAPRTAGRAVDPEVGRHEGYLEAAMIGSQDGMRLLGGIVALLLSFLGLVSLADGILGWLAGLVGIQGLDIKTVLGYLAWPLALFMGVPPEDALTVARLLGERAVVSEIPAYMDLAALLKGGGLIYARSAMVTSYALCGFAHVASVAIFVGGFAALAPARMRDLSRLGFKALWAATLATVLTGCVAGVFSIGGTTLLGLTN